MEVPSDKQKIIALLLCFFLGVFGAHRLYTGHTLFAVVYFFTGGLFGIGALYDLVTMLTGSYKDSDGKALA